MTDRPVDRWLAKAARSPFPGGRVVVLAVFFGVVLCVIGGVLAWRSYTTRAEQAESRIMTVASAGAMAAELFFSDRISILQAVAELPAFDAPEPEDLGPVLSALAGQDLAFGGGLGWADGNGVLQVSTALDDSLLPFDLSDRDYASVVLEDRMPHVGAARQSLTGATVIPVAVPTFADGGELSGMLIAGVLSDDLVGEIPALAPSGFDLRVVDRSGEMILDGGVPTSLEPPVNHELIAPGGPSLVIGSGLRGDPNRIAAISRVDSSAWVLVAEQNRSSALAAARSRLVTESAVLAAFTLVTLGAALYAAQRVDDSHRAILRGAHDLAAMERLSEKLSRAPDPHQVAMGVIEVFGQVFEAGAVVVGLVDNDREDMRVFVEGRGDGGTEFAVPLEALSVLNAAFASEALVILDADEIAAAYPETETAAEGSGVVAGRFMGPQASGVVGLYLSGGFPPHDADLELFEGMVPMLSDSFGRALAADHERRASRTFQEALLPRDTLGIDVPLQRAVRYCASESSAEVGGDWYDLWMVDEHRVGLVVGDVVGRGIVAAAAMGQLRSAVRAAVGAAMAPTDALGYVDALTQQITGSGGATVVLGILDLRNGAVRLASAGHLPPLLAGPAGARVLTGMEGTPLGFFPSTASRRGMTVKLGPEDTLVLYSDGLIERRDEIIDEGIARALAVLGEHQELPVEALANKLIAVMTEPDNPDDVALICVRPVTDPPRHFTGVVPLAQFESLRQSLFAWMEKTNSDFANEVADRVEEAVATISDLVDPEYGDEVMVEADPVDGRLTVVVEYRRRPSSVGDSTDREILRRWGDGDMTPRGPRTRFEVG